MQYLRDHVNYESGGRKSVCASYCLAHFGIAPDTYNYTSSPTNRLAYINVLRRFGWSVRSRMSEFKVTYKTTMTQLKTAMKRSKYNAADRFLVVGYQKTSAHLMVLDGNGNVLVDTARGMKWKINKIHIVEK